jgi:hypothetical protein
VAAFDHHPIGLLFEKGFLVLAHFALLEKLTGENAETLKLSKIGIIFRYSTKFMDQEVSSYY